MHSLLIKSLVTIFGRIKLTHLFVTFLVGFTSVMSRTESSPLALAALVVLLIALAVVGGSATEASRRESSTAPLVWALPFLVLVARLLPGV